MRCLCALSSFLVVFLGFGPEPKAAEPEPEICRKLKEISSRDPNDRSYLSTLEERCRSLYWREFKPRPLSRILTVRERRFYSRTLAANDCASATRLLQRRFVEAHPKAPSILRNPRDYKEWKSSVLGLRFQSLYLCLTLRRIQRRQGEIDRKGLVAEPFLGFERSLASKSARALPGEILMRHHEVHLLLLAGATTKNPVIALALLKLSTEGKVIRFHRLYESYLALALQAEGLRDPVIKEVIARPLNTSDKEKVERVVRSRASSELPHYPD